METFRKRLCKRGIFFGISVGWPRMSGRATSGTSRPSLGDQVLALFSLHLVVNIAVQKSVWENAWKSQTSFYQTSATSLFFGIGQNCLLEKGSFQKCLFSRDSRDFPECGKYHAFQNDYRPT